MTGRRFLGCACAVLVGALALPTPVAAATVVPLTLEEMSRHASDAFAGTVESAVAHWNADHTRIETRVRIRVDTDVLGRGRGVRVLRVPGGEVGAVGMRVPGAPAFTVGERVLVIAEPRGDGVLRPVGLFQGVLRVRVDPFVGSPMVEAPGPAWGADGAPLAPGTPPAGRIPALALDEVIRRMRGAR